MSTEELVLWTTVEFSFAEEEHQRSITVSGEGMASKTGPEGLIHALRSP